MRSAIESPPTAREQNAWQDGAFRFEHALQSYAYRVDRAEQTRSAHSSPRAQEYAQNALGHRGQDSSQALGQVISPTVSPSTSIFEPRSQKARVGALERKNFPVEVSVVILRESDVQKSPLDPLCSLSSSRPLVSLAARCDYL